LELEILNLVLDNSTKDLSAATKSY